MTLTCEIPEEFSHCLPETIGGWAEVLTSGIRHQRQISSFQLNALADLTEFQAGLPSPTDVMKLRPTEEVIRRTLDLLSKRSASGLSETEEAEFQEFLHMEHLVRIAKRKAARLINQVVPSSATVSA